MFYKNTAKDEKKKKNKGKTTGESINVFRNFTLTQLKRKRVNSEPLLVKNERGEKNHTVWTNAISKYSVLLRFEPTETKCVIRRLVQLP